MQFPMDLIYVLLLALIVLFCTSASYIASYTDIDMDSSVSQSLGRSPFKDLTNTSTSVPTNSTSNDKAPSRQGWYARLSADKKAEYLEKQRMARQQKKAASVSENSTKPQSTGQGYYARLTDEKKKEYLEKQRISRQKRKMAASMNQSELSSPRMSPGKMIMDFVYHLHENGFCVPFKWVSSTVSLHNVGMVHIGSGKSCITDQVEHQMH